MEALQLASSVKMVDTGGSGAGGGAVEKSELGVESRPVVSTQRTSRVRVPLPHCLEH